MAPAQTAKVAPLQDSSDPWRFVVLVSKFCVLFFDAGLAKSFGVLIADMVSRFDSDYETIALICSLPSGLLVLLRFGMSIVYLINLVTLNDYFPKSFIFFNTFSTLGLTLGAFCLPVVVERSLRAYGYSGAFLILGGMCLNGVPCAMTVRPPRDKDKLSVHPTTVPETECIMEGDKDSSKPLLGCDRPSSENRNTPRTGSGFGSGEALQLSSLLSKLKSCACFAEPLYALVIPSFTLFNICMYGWMLFLVPGAESVGIESSRAVYLASIAAFGGVLGKLSLLVAMLVKLDLMVVYLISCSVFDVTIFITSASDAYFYLAIMAFIQGFAVFMLDSLGSVLTKLTIEDEENVPIALTATSFLSGIGSLIGGALSGRIYDITHSYKAVLDTLGLVLCSMIVNLIVVFVIIRRRAKKKAT
ncbi:monocarboxylate transporter 5-like [Diadema setosum]|uniref:monocarboxylate transporter 5-like n=1 Tax=Diadema setosum TaxID=31175 RepID=UPI003B3A0FC9